MDPNIPVPTPRSPFTQPLVITSLFVAFLFGIAFGFFICMSKGKAELEQDELPRQSVRTSTAEKQNETAAENELIEYIDPTTGISFSYPKSWGNVTIEDERGSCAANYDEDPCNFRIYLFKDLADAGIFLATETAGHHANPVGRGAFWGDGAGNIDENYQMKCKQDNECTLITNSEGLVIAKYTTEIFDWGDESAIEHAYNIYSNQGPYYGVRLSPLRIKTQNPEIERIFGETIIDSLKLSKH